MPLQIGTQAPDFTLASTAGMYFNLYKEMKGKPCILYFYSTDFSSGCTTQACGFKDTFELFQELNIYLFGISRDSLQTHQQFRKELNLPFHLLADNQGEMSILYKATPPFLPFFAKRITYLLDANQKIISVYENLFSPAEHIKTMVDVVVTNSISKA